MKRTISFILNGKPTTLEVDPERMLLWVLRTDFGLTGTEFGCGEGLCGSCSVLVDGRVERSCQLPIGRVDGAKLLTIEGLAASDAHHPVQSAFVEHDALDWGRCTWG
jgi:aerobic-type carbon monoxide dehydrogenase small subunit (CoxS/CutS family)